MQFVMVNAQEFSQRLGVSIVLVQWVLKPMFFAESDIPSPDRNSF